jgi:sulfonate transport system substrate-binding protein
MRRREFLIASALGAVGGAMLPKGASAAQSDGFTEWGWPLPYQQVSAKSIKWLEEKGWLPLGLAWQGPWSGQNTITAVIAKLDLLGKRGLKSKFQAFAAGPDVNEAIAAARFHVGNGGNFPFTSLLDRGIPVKAIAVTSPNLKHSTVVPVDSKLKTLADLKGSNPPATIGIVTGSSAEFYFTQAAEVVGLKIGRDVILKNMPISEQLALPQGVAAVVPWEPSVAILVNERKTGREIDTIFPYNFFEGNFYVRQELIDNVPDVVQAVSDAFAESNLWIRLYPDKAADILAEEPLLRHYDKALLLQQTDAYNNFYKPTSTYPFATFWGEENARIAKWLLERNRVQKQITAKDYAAAFDPRFMNKTYQKLGWTIPQRPPFISADWKGQIGKLPYPPYPNINDPKSRETWPEKGDLVRPWQFAGKTYEP